MDFARERDASRSAGSRAASTSRSTRSCCRRSTWPTATTRASRPKCSTTTSAPATSRASRRVVEAMQRAGRVDREGPRRAAGRRRRGTGPADRRQLRPAAVDLPACRPAHVEMVERPGAAGASAQFAGSGGAIVGTYPDAADLRPPGSRTVGHRLPRAAAEDRVKEKRHARTVGQSDVPRNAPPKFPDSPNRTDFRYSHGILGKHSCQVETNRYKEIVVGRDTNSQ